MKALCVSIFFIQVFSIAIAFSQATEKWNLERCITYALKNNLQVRQSELTTRISAKDKLQSKLNVLPNLDANAIFSNNFGNGLNPQTYQFEEGNSQSLQFSLQTNFPIFTGLQQVFNIEKARYDLLASQFDYENSKNNITLSVASSYLQVLLNKEIEKVAQKQKELTSSQKEIVQSRIRAGALPETSIYDVESQLGRDEVNIVNARNATDLSLLSLQQLLQLASRDNFDVETPDVPVDNMADISALSSQAIYEFAVHTQPVILSSEAKVKSANASRKAAIGAISPTLSVFASLSSGYFSQDNKKLAGATYDTLSGTVLLGGTTYPFQTNYVTPVPIYTGKTFQDQLQSNFRKVIGLSLDVPLFSKGQKVLNIQRAKLQMQIREMQLDGSKNQLQQDIEQAFGNAKAAAQSYLANKKSFDASQKAYQATETRYKAGMASNFDIQQSKTNLLSSESEMIKAKYTYVFRLKILDFYQGKAITLN